MDVYNFCPTCGEIFTKCSNLYRHIRNLHPDNNNGLPQRAMTTCECHICGKRFTRVDNLQRHITKFHPAPTTSIIATAAAHHLTSTPNVAIGPSSTIASSSGNNPAFGTSSCVNILEVPSSQNIVNFVQDTSMETANPLTILTSIAPSQELPLSIPSTQQLVDMIDVNILNCTPPLPPPRLPFRSVDLDLTPSHAPTEYQIDDLSTGELEELMAPQHSSPVCNLFCNNNLIVCPTREVINVDEIPTQDSLSQATSSLKGQDSTHHEVSSSSRSNIENASSPQWNGSTPSSLLRYGQPSRTPSIESLVQPSLSNNHCMRFPAYCAAGRPHTEDRCIAAMNVYYKIGTNHYACPTCHTVIKHWLNFMEYHSHHAGQFTAGQKKELSIRVRCPTFPTYCIATNHDHPQECQRLMLTYYKSGAGYVCPYCDMYVEDEMVFIHDHAAHAGQFARGQKRRLTPHRVCSYNYECGL